MTDVYNATGALTRLAQLTQAIDQATAQRDKAQDVVNAHDIRLYELKEQFDETRERAIEFCPALLESYGTQETVKLVDGQIAVVPGVPNG